MQRRPMNTHGSLASVTNQPCGIPPSLFILNTGGLTGQVESLRHQEIGFGSKEMHLTRMIPWAFALRREVALMGGCELPTGEANGGGSLASLDSPAWDCVSRP